MDSLFDDAEDDFDNSFAESEVDAAAPPEAVEISPRTNPDLVGHEEVEKLLLDEFNAGRLPHALILSGPAGIGKATLAYRLVRFLLSQTEDQGPSLFGEPAKAESLHIAPDHPVFKRVASGGHADLLVVGREFDEKKGRMQESISVDTVRRINPFLRKTAAEGGWRAVIVEDAEDFNQNSQNALLKILEEPPRKTILVLCTSQPGSFLPTIRSRCRTIPMEPLSEKNIATLLNKFVPGLSGDQRTSLSRIGEGSIGRAMTFQVNDGLDVYKQLLKNVAMLPQVDMLAVHDLAEKFGKYGAENSYYTAAGILTRWAGRLARLEARNLPIGDILPGDGDIFQKLATLYPPRHFLGVWERLSQLFRQADQYNLDKRQTLINAFLVLQKPDFTGPNI